LVQLSSARALLCASTLNCWNKCAVRIIGVAKQVWRQAVGQGRKVPVFLTWSSRFFLLRYPGTHTKILPDEVFYIGSCHWENKFMSKELSHDNSLPESSSLLRNWK